MLHHAVLLTLGKGLSLKGCSTPPPPPPSPIWVLHIKVGCNLDGWSRHSATEDLSEALACMPVI